MKLLVLVLFAVGLSLGQQESLDCSETACIMLYEYCDAPSCHTYNGCCQGCCDEACVECLVSPCENWACEGHPEYTCRDDYCGSCNRLWFDGNGARTTCENELFGVDPCAAVTCPTVEFCAGCGTIRDGCCERCCEESCANCFLDPCDGYSCQGYPGYKCLSNYCGGCSRDWVNSSGQPVTCQVEMIGPACATVDCLPVDVDSCDCGLEPTDSCCQGCCRGECASCLLDPCEGFTCLDDEKYICEPNYCEGCNRLWYDENRNRVYCSMESNIPPVDCSLVRCSQPVDCACGVETVGCCDVCIEEVFCDMNPCESIACGDNADYTCEPNYCGGCNRDWFDTRGNQVKCADEIFVGDCAAVECPMVEMLCICGETTVNCCPACIPTADCLVNPCDNVSCAGHSDYTCEANYCGGCNRDWIDRNGNLVECERELFNTEWVLECAKDIDCALHNVDHGFSCCYEGMCEHVDFAIDTWRPVNNQWWQSQHDACSHNCGPQPGCPSFAPANDNFVAICKNAQCTKVNALLVVPTNSVTSNENSSGGDASSFGSSNSSNNSSSASLVSFWALIIALVFIAA